MAENDEAAMTVIFEHRKRIKTITLYNGTEFHGHLVFEQFYPVKCYFSTPY